MILPQDESVKRRRIVGKGGGLSAVQQAKKVMDYDAHLEDDFPERRSLWQRLFSLRVKQLTQVVKDQGMIYADARRRARELVREQEVTREVMDALVTFAPLEFEGDTAFKTYCAFQVQKAEGKRHMQNETKENDGMTFCCSTQEMLMTWNGSWGLFSGCPVSLQPGDSAAGVDEILKATEWVKKQPRFQKLWEQAKLHCNALAEYLHADDHSFALEVCPSTVDPEKEVRVHLHQFLTSMKPMKLQNTSLASVRFLGTAAHVKPNYLRIKGRRREDGWHMGHFYLRCPKIGSIISAGTLQLWSSIECRPQWIMKMFVKGKLTASDARKLFVECGFQVEYYVSSLDFIETKRREFRLEQKYLEIERLLRSTLAPPRRYYKLDTEWFPQYKKLQLRYKFLVLEGASEVGKSQWVRCLADPGKVLELNCASAKSLNMREFKTGETEVVLADEATPQFVLSEKKVFQAGNAWIDLGASATSKFAYKVNVWRVKFVVCSNRWSRDMETLSPEDSAWLTKNCVYLEVTSPMYVTRRPTGTSS